MQKFVLQGQLGGIFKFTRIEKTALSPLCYFVADQVSDRFAMSLSEQQRLGKHSIVITKKQRTRLSNMQIVYRTACRCVGWFRQQLRTD